MQRDIEALQNDVFDLIVIGGGVTGAAIAWDASLRGLKVALLEKKDFGHGTSSATSKMIHGGLRYLENFEFSVVRESLRERRLLEKNIPHLAFPLPFLFPVYDYQPVPRLMLKTGLVFYDLLAYDKNELPYSEKFIPNHQWLSKTEALKLEPRLNARGLKGAYLYYDVLDQHPERALMEYILSAHQKGAVLANYVEFSELVLEKNPQKDHPSHATKNRNLEGVKVIDRLTQKEFLVKGSVVINAAGPWVDQVLGAMFKTTKKKIVRSKGIHLLLPRINKDCALTFSTKDKKHFFILPWLNYTLLGTTDDKFTGDLDHVRVSRSEAEKFLRLVNEYYPLDIQTKHILHAYAGIRPLAVGGRQENTYAVSRKHEIINHRKTDQINGLFSVIGGKWTTSRSLAEIVVNTVLKDQNMKRLKSTTADTPLVGGRFSSSFEKSQYDIILRYKSTIDSSVVSALFSYYGQESEKIIKRMEAMPKTSKSKLSRFVLASIEHAVEEESACKLSDFIMRRNSLGNTGIPDRRTLEEISQVMAGMLGWDKARKENEIREYVETYQMIMD